MGVVFEAGYTLPGGDEPLTHARILHDKNRFRAKSVTASDEVAGFEGSAADNSLTYEAWKPFANALTSGEDFSDAAWTVTQATLGSDNQTLTENGNNTIHHLEQAFTYSAVEYVASVKFKQIGYQRGVQIVCDDGTTQHNAMFQADGDVSAGNANGAVYSLGNDTYLLRIYFTAAAAAGNIEVRLANASDVVTYAGDSTSGIQFLEIAMHESAATWDLSMYDALPGDVFCIAGHNIGEGNGRLAFLHDSNDDTTYTSIGTASPTDNSPVMFIHEGITSKEWRITVDRCPLPEIAVIRVGSALQMERPLYGEYTPFGLARQTELRSNYSETGQFLGRTKLRTFGEFPIAWRMLSRAWVLANWLPAIKAIETEPFFLASDPSTFDEVAYCQTTGPVAAMQQSANGFLATQLNVRALGYD